MTRVRGADSGGGADETRFAYLLCPTRCGARTSRAAMAERKALNATIREGWRVVREIEKG